MIVNGVTLPDIPAEVLAQYPNQVIVSTQTDSGTMYCLYAAAGQFAYVLREVLGTDSDGIISLSSGYVHYAFIQGVSDNIGWSEYDNPVVDESTTGAYIPLNFYTFVWSNYELKTIIGIDENGNPVYKETETKPTRVSIGRSLVDGYAKEVQRLTGTTEQMNAVQLRDLLKTAKSGGTGAEDSSEVIVDTNRVSIGYELFNDIVDEVQRLTGTTDKMNAITAYRKLKSVIAASGGIVIDGVTLPAIPADLLAEYPYAEIDKGTIEQEGVTTIVWALNLCKARFAVAPAGMEIYPGETWTTDARLFGNQNAATYTIIEGQHTEWTLDVNGSGQPMSGPSNLGTIDYSAFGGPKVTAEMVWANHDVCYATSYDYDTMIPTIGTEVYFHSSV